MEEFDYVIVGAGAAGCVLANRLTASGKHSVAILEAGGKDNNIFIKIPAGFNKTVYNPKLNWGYETAPGPYIDNRKIPFPRGKVLGGSGSINGHLYVRGQSADYDMWAQLGCRGWAWDDVLPYFKRACAAITGRFPSKISATRMNSRKPISPPMKHSACRARPITIPAIRKAPSCISK
jgi:choline dehydrogenase